MDRRGRRRRTRRRHQRWIARNGRAGHFSDEMFKRPDPGEGVRLDAEALRAAWSYMRRPATHRIV